MMKIDLPVVLDRQIEEYEANGVVPKRFMAQNRTFYSINYVIPYDDFINMCVINSGAREFVIALPEEEVKEKIDKSSLIHFHKN